MKIRNRMIIGLIALGCVLLGIVHGVVFPHMEREQEAKVARQQHPLTHDFSEVTKYSHPYMGNASNLSNLFVALPLNQLGATWQLYPEELTADLRYQQSAEAVDESLLKQSLIYNATAAFALIDNLQTMRFDFTGTVYSVDRSGIEQWYGTEAKQLADPMVWQSQVQEPLDSAEYVEACMAAIYRITR